jgi:hypothetical protein
MQSRWKYVGQITVSSLALILPGFLCGDTIYTYTSGNGVDVGFSLTTISPDGIPSGTDVDPDIAPGSFSMTYPAPAEDNAGFPLGSSPAYSNLSLSTLEIGTDALGDVTSWDISGTQFASYPAFGGENPLDFFCDYSVTFKPSGGSGPLSIDHDAGFCPSSAVGTAAVGSWSAYTVPLSTTPEPRNSALIVGALLGLMALVTRRKRAAIAR